MESTVLPNGRALIGAFATSFGTVACGKFRAEEGVRFARFASPSGNDRYLRIAVISHWVVSHGGHPQATASASTRFGFDPRTRPPPEEAAELPWACVGLQRRPSRWGAGPRSTVALAKDMNAAAMRSSSFAVGLSAKSATPPNCAPRSLRSGKSSGSWRTRHCTTSPDAAARCYELRRAARGLVEQERPQRIAHPRQVGRALRQSRHGSLDRPIGEPVRRLVRCPPAPKCRRQRLSLLSFSFARSSSVSIGGIGNGRFEHAF